MRSRISSFLLPSWATLSPFFADVRTVSRRLPFCASLSRFLWAGAALGCRLPKVRGLLETPDWHNGPLLELSRATSPLKYDSECRGLANIQRQFPPPEHLRNVKHGHSSRNVKYRKQKEEYGGDGPTGTEQRRRVKCLNHLRAIRQPEAGISRGILALCLRGRF
jgi:hypothetical protein